MTDHPDTTSAAIDDYRVELDAYHGPLDLLLYLVKRHEIDLYDIPIAKLTEQYLKHLALMKDIDVELAGEFLVMAATLLEIKSQMLLPLVQSGDGAADAGEASLPGGEDSGDPRFELVRQLLAYKRFKDAAGELDRRREEWDKRFAHRPSRQGNPVTVTDGDDADSEAEAATVEIDLEDASVIDLCKAFARLMESIGQTPTHDVVYDDTPIALHQEDILDRLRRDGAMTLAQIFIGRSHRAEMVGLFLAMLELVKLRLVRVRQEGIGEEIALELWPDDDPAPSEAAAPDWRNPETGEVEYDWPSEGAKKAAERRARLRASRLSKLREGQAGEDVLEEAVDLDDDEAMALDPQFEEVDSESDDTEHS